MAHAAERHDVLYGVMAEFDSVQALVDAAKRAVSAGFTKLEAAIEHASAINRAVFARKPLGDPYRGLLAAVDSSA